MCSSDLPPTPQEMRAQIEAARVVTKEMKKQAKRDEKMARLNAAKKAEEGGEPAPVETPAEEAPVEEVATPQEDNKDE